MTNKYAICSVGEKSQGSVQLHGKPLPTDGIHYTSEIPYSADYL
jgi:hypothetical protein